MKLFQKKNQNLNQNLYFSFCLASRKYTRTSTFHIKKLPLIFYNTNFQNVRSFENSVIPSSLRGQVLWSLKQLHKFKVWKITIATVIHFCLQLSSMFLILHLTRDWHRDNMATVTNIGKLLSVEGKVKVI